MNNIERGSQRHLHVVHRAVFESPFPHIVFVKHYTTRDVIRTALTEDALRVSNARCLAPRRSTWSPGHQYDNVDQLHDSWKNCMTSAPVARTIITFFTIPATVSPAADCLLLPAERRVQALVFSFVRSINKHTYVFKFKMILTRTRMDKFDKAKQV